MLRCRRSGTAPAWGLAAWMCTAGATDAQPPASVPIEGAIGTGYDSNPAQSSDGSGLFFADVALSIAGQMDRRMSGLDWRLDAWYQDYEGPDGIGRLAATGIWQTTLDRIPGALAVSTEAVLYRDEIIPADSRHELAVRGHFDRILTPRLDLMSFAELRWLDYLDPAYPWEGRPGPGRTGPSRAGTSGGAHSATPSEWGGGVKHREDWLASLGVEGRWHLSADASGAMALSCARNSSSIVPDGYGACAADLSFTLMPAPRWQARIDAGWYRTDYERTRSGFRRQDTGSALGASLQWSAGPGEVLCELRWLENQSDLPIKSFQQTVTRCGLVWRF
ncbi:hypothetical protein [Thiocapsa marina]|uniref:Uncharacterized protein n=1 Tax=Thiocapsa marina 5811 TaxID=768671 RepID=F9U8M5_9GAMM|nr:hypothetical protein [Thiocapsa marina]EGV19133.1 hypothetical protein ThimaDRAFT_1277 [Thiocapsa marina 5811]